MVEEKKSSLISDVAGLSSPITKLIETIGSGIGQLAKPWQTKRNAKADAEAIQTISKTLNETLGEVTYNTPNFSITVKNDCIEETIISRLVNLEIDRQFNLKDIISETAAILETKEQVSEEPVSKDWTTRFISIAQDISNAELKNLWAQILAGEIEHPNSFSLRTLDLLKNISQDEAEKIQNIYKCCLQDFYGNNYIFGYINSLESMGISFSDALILDELNLCKSDLVYTISKKQGTYFKVGNTNNLIMITNETEADINMPCIKLTKIGNQIFNITNVEYKNDDIVALLEFLRQNKKLKFELIDVTELSCQSDSIHEIC